MLVRIVQLYLIPEQTENFLKLYASHQSRISEMKGCLSLELLVVSEHQGHVATLSRWQEAQDLENYRNSEFFKNLWSQVKPLFAQSAKAVSYQIWNPEADAE